MGKKKNLTGIIFGNLEVLEESEKRDKNGNVYWVCRCSCGKTKEINGRSLTTGRTISCGCYNLENNQKKLGQKKYKKTHGKSYSRLYLVYKAMKNRCYNKNVKKYKNYGALGVSVCSEWKNDFVSFYNWAVKNGYDENAKFGDCTLDRINVYGNYCPENCRWISNKEQQKNKRKKNETR